MSKKITLQKNPGLPPWALTDLLRISHQFHCHINIHDDEITIDGRKLLEVISLIRPDLSRVVVGLKGKDKKDALESILNSHVGRFVAQGN